VSRRAPADPLASVERAEAAERAQALRALLRAPLLTSSGPDKQAFTLVRRHAAWLRVWLDREAGWPLQVDRELARLAKVPGGLADGTRPALSQPAKVPFSRRRYALACLALAALERAETQVTLGWLAERVLALANDPALAEAGLRFALDTRDERADLVAVARLLLGTGVLGKVAGDEQAFVNASGDALYDVHRRALAGLLSARRGPSTIGATGFDERLAMLVTEPIADTDEGRNRAVRHRLTRRLLDDPVVYYDQLGEDELDYLATQRGALLRRLTTATGLVAEVRAEGIALVDPTGEATDLAMPEEGTDGHATLLLAEQLAAADQAAPGAVTTVPALEARMRQLADEHRANWRRSAAEPGGAVELTRLALSRLEALGLVERLPGGVRARPALARFAYGEPVVQRLDEASA
jgi:uncharacterized protein (TIGR02678 family)